MHSNLTFRTLLGFALFALLLAPAPVFADTNFPRGPGLYFDPIKLGILIAVFLGWVKLCAWIDVDAHRHRLEPAGFNGMLLFAGVFGFLIFWNLPSMLISGFVFLALIGVALGFYFPKRNRRADPEDQLFNKEHYDRLFAKYSPTRPKGAKAAKEEGHAIRFMSRSQGAESEDNVRVERVQHSKGYKAALEMVWNAIDKRATDLHLEPTPNEMAVRFRIDGMLTNVEPFTRSMGDAVVNIFKVLCNLDITEKRKPQDGSFSAQVENRLVEFRVATAGSVAGEKLVMRVLDASAQLADLTHVGMTETMQRTVRDIITKPHGLFLVCGPTGSGKSTTLYACLHEIDRFQQNIITVENPVEYRLDGITQIEVNPKAGKTFASELRSILRQDPDVILIGEIRDKETAEIACQAAQTGHMVFSTLHANDAVTAIARLIDLGVPPFMLATAVQAVLSQRLVRRLCKSCRKRVKPSADTLKKLKIDPDAVRYIYRASEPEDSGNEADDSNEEIEVCANCGGSGYFKRTGIFDLLVINDKIRELIRENPNVQEIRKVATESGLRTLLEDGSRLVIEGETSVQELLRVGSK